MKEELKNYARLGVVYHMLYSRCMSDPDYHVATLEAFLKRGDIETFDFCLPYGRERQARLIPAIKASGLKNIVYATHLVPLRKLSFASDSYFEQAQMRMIIADMVEQAGACGCSGFIFASGGPRFSEGTKANHDAFYDFCCWLCESLAKYNIDALLEPFDYDFDKSYLYGPLDKNIELVGRVARNFPNIGIELDIAHLPLMREELVSSIRRSAKWLKRVHFGNCVMKDTADPFHGDRHPPVGYPGGEIDTPQLRTALQALLDTGFLSAEKRGDVVLELNPFPGKTEDESVADNFQRVNRAWQAVMPAANA
ncbi:MAG: sugar phosphate isomerase/epimerase [Opitutaceae bacterium]|jgi:sugar phosphate isomerase/epimerase|nr:sugar phosphate isomerase/epimerase [Opitutaceae bacterium]